MRLQRLTGLEIEKIEAEQKDLATRIIDYKEIIGSHDRKLVIIRDELGQMKTQYAINRQRKSEIIGI